MLAAAPGGLPRYRRAVAFAHRLHAALPQLPAGVASLSNRLLPYLFPTVDGRAYDAVLDRAYGIQRPLPAVDLDRRVTTFDALRQASGHAFFSPQARRRIVVVLSDAETQPFDAAGVLRQLRRHGATPVVVPTAPHTAPTAQTPAHLAFTGVEGLPQTLGMAALMLVLGAGLWRTAMRRES
jgi:hypothetical protein